MRKFTLAALAAVALGASAGAAFAQSPYAIPGTPPDGKGGYAGGYRGEAERRSSDLPFFVGVPFGQPAIVDEPEYTGTVVDRPGYLPGTLPDGKGNAAGGYRGEVGRRLGY